MSISHVTSGKFWLHFFCHFCMTNSPIALAIYPPTSLVQVSGHAQRMHRQRAHVYAGWQACVLLCSDTVTGMKSVNERCFSLWQSQESSTDRPALLELDRFVSSVCVFKEHTSCPVHMNTNNTNPTFFLSVQESKSFFFFLRCRSKMTF